MAKGSKPMWRQGIKIAVFLFLSGIILITNSFATPGEQHFVQENNTNIYEAPSANSPIVMRLNQGDKVIEWRRQGSWMRISQIGEVGNEGWIKISSIISEVQNNQIEITLDPFNRFMLKAKVNGRMISFLVDTGSTITMLTPSDARKAGLNMGSLRYRLAVETAGGTISAAFVMLKKVQIGQLTVPNVDALVSKKQMGTSLLGVSFLKRLESYEVRDDRLIIRW